MDALRAVIRIEPVAAARPAGAVAVVARAVLPEEQHGARAGWKHHAGDELGLRQVLVARRRVGERMTVRMPAALNP
jgi:hypothetical protein